jgi:hypothetical protein
VILAPLGRADNGRGELFHALRLAIQIAIQFLIRIVIPFFLNGVVISQGNKLVSLANDFTNGR